MTTIVYRDGVMAADSRAYAGDKMPIGSKMKIRKLEDGTLIGVTSTIPGGSEAVVELYARNNGNLRADPSAGIPEHFTMLAVKPNGEVYYASNTPYLSGPLEGPWFAIGSGEQFAAGALAMGANAKRAVAVACDLDAWTDYPVRTIEIG